MSRITTVQFRGTEWQVSIDCDGGYEPDTDCHVIEWHFEGVSLEDHQALAVTEEEEQAIYDQIIEHLRERISEPDYYEREYMRDD